MVDNNSVTACAATALPDRAPGTGNSTSILRHTLSGALLDGSSRGQPLATPNRQGN